MAIVRYIQADICCPLILTLLVTHACRHIRVPVLAGTLRWYRLICGIWTDYLLVYIQPRVPRWRIIHSHGIVRECCKGDDASQWGNEKFDPLPRPNPLTDHYQKLRT